MSGLSLKVPRKRAFAILACGGAVCLGLGLTEVAFRVRDALSAQADSLDPGFIRPDVVLGWSLTPGWSGRHRHAEFDVRYRINEHGFRADAAWPAARTGRLVAVVGDSFTFGIGVNDDQTLVHQMNSLGGGQFVNFSVPGYSTDQEALLVEREVLAVRPDAVVLVVYLGNDLFDNLLSQPLQLKAPKPRFELAGNELTLRSADLYPTGRSDSDAMPDLALMVLGEGHRHTWRTRLERRSAAFRAMNQSVLPEPALPDEFGTRMEAPTALAARILNRIRERCEVPGAQFMTVLLAGRSFVETPGSVSAQYQDVLRRMLADRLQHSGMTVLDLASAMQSAARSNSEPWFYAKDGHLTPAGNLAAARLLERLLREGAGGQKEAGIRGVDGEGQGPDGVRDARQASASRTAGERRWRRHRPSGAYRS